VEGAEAVRPLIVILLGVPTEAAAITSVRTLLEGVKLVIVVVEPPADVTLTTAFVVPQV